jgi:hypothetical protein
MKSIRPEIISAPDGLPGHGLLVLQGIGVDAFDPFGQIEILIQRNQDSRFLALDANWSPSQTWHQVDRALSSGEELVLALGPGIIDPVVKNTQMTYLLEVRCLETAARGVLRIRDGVLSSHAAGSSNDPVARVSGRVAPVAEPSPAEPEQVVQVGLEQEPPATPPKKSNNLIWLLLIALVVGVIAAYFIWMGLKPSPVTTAPSTQQPASPATSAPVAAAPAPCSTAALSAAKDDLVFLQECLKTNPEGEKVLEVIAAAKSAKRCDIVQRLYAFKSQAGDVAVALAYAREFDPQFHQAGCIASPDKATAIYWYELVLSSQADNADAKARVQALKN